jgi:WD40 repeat protein
MYCFDYNPTVSFYPQGIWPPNADGSEINSVDLCPGNQNLLVVGDDFNMVKLFKYPCLLPSSQSKDYRGHAAEVQNVRFNHSGDWVYSVGGLDKAVMQYEVKSKK